jgi:hypothetical protein
LIVRLLQLYLQAKVRRSISSRDIENFVTISTSQDVSAEDANCLLWHSCLRFNWLNLTACIHRHPQVQMGRRQKCSARKGCRNANSRKQQHPPQSSCLLDLDCVLQHPLLACSLDVVARLLCTSKATAAAVHQHTAGYLQQLRLVLEDLEEAEQVAAWLCRNGSLTMGLRSLFLQPPQLLSTAGISKQVEAEQVIAGALEQVRACISLEVLAVDVAVMPIRQLPATSYQTTVWCCVSQAAVWGSSMQCSCWTHSLLCCIAQHLSR